MKTAVKKGNTPCIVNASVCIVNALVCIDNADQCIVNALDISEKDVETR